MFYIFFTSPSAVDKEVSQLREAFSPKLPSKKTPDGTPILSSLFPHIAFVPIFLSLGDFDFTSLQLMLVPCVGPKMSSSTSPVQITFLFPCDHWTHIMEFCSCIC